MDEELHDAQSSVHRLRALRRRSLRGSTAWTEFVRNESPRQLGRVIDATRASVRLGFSL